MTPWTLRFMEFSRPEYWSGYLSILQASFPTGIKPGSPALQADSFPAELPGKPKKVIVDAKFAGNHKRKIGKKMEGGVRTGDI